MRTREVWPCSSNTWIWRLTPVALPLMRRPGVSLVTRAILRANVRRAMRELGATTTTLVESSPLVPVAATVGETKSVYWAQDDYEGGADLLGQSAATKNIATGIILVLAVCIDAVNRRRQGRTR